ncbi:hypothetical protein Q5P01_005423 [Channa striata]|uniref:SPIN-DOC-like zinc-finger domain-containing protein n=1 Tax=Channa striata TaxID=64152 RepID=A0AA88SYH6_CHASR|nr:hypothetical protein Q5P01_005423 [Channa striata]
MNFFKEINGKCVCLICNEDVAVMKEYNVRRHYETKHQSYASYTGAERAQKFKQMAASRQAQQHYEVAQLTAQHGKPFSDGDFIKQCLIKVTEVMCPEKVQDFNNVCLSRNTVVRRIEDLSANLKLQLREKACAFDFYSIACDESTDAQIFFRGVDDNFCCTEELLDMMSLKGTTTGGNIFDAVSEAVEKMGLKWDKLCGVKTDGAPAMTGERKGMASMVCVKVKEIRGKAVRMHCIIHQEALCAKTVQLGDVMNTVVKTVNIIRAKGLYHREFQAFLSDVDAEYGDVLYHSDVCLLSRGSLLQRFYSLKSEIDKFLKEKGQPLHELSDPLWLADLAFLVDLQGKEQLVSHLYAHMKAFCVKLCLFETQLRSFNAAHFPALSEFKSAFPKAEKEKYASVITSLVTEFNQRFQDFSVIEKQIKLFLTPFLVDAEEVEESLQLELIEMQCDDSLKSQHQLLSLPDFYQSLDHAKFPLMRRHAKRMMSLFGSTYICEQTFSLLNQNKSRLRSTMTDSHLCEVLSQPPSFLLTSQPSFNPKDSITAPTESNVLHIIGELEIHTVIMCQYVTSCVWPGPLLIFLYLALTKKTLDTPDLERGL